MYSTEERQRHTVQLSTIYISDEKDNLNWVEWKNKNRVPLLSPQKALVHATGSYVSSCLFNRFCFVSFCFVFLRLGLAVYPRLASNPWSSYLCLLGTKITRMGRHFQISMWSLWCFGKSMNATSPSPEHQMGASSCIRFLSSAIKEICKQTKLSG